MKRARALVAELQRARRIYLDTLPYTRWELRRGYRLEALIHTIMIMRPAA